MKDRCLKQANKPIRIRFPDGVYSFWEASTDKNDQRIWFRVKDTGPDGRSKPKDGSHTPEERMTNLVKELAALDPEAALRVPGFHRFRPADMSQVVVWLAGHRFDLYDLASLWVMK